MRFDFITMTEALGERCHGALERVQIVNVAPDNATYPQ